MPIDFYDPVKGHTGIDVIMPVGTQLTLDTETVVMQQLNQNQMGLTLYLKDKDGNILVFGHLSDILVSEGGRVGTGSVFAHSGNTGSATTGPHLHFEIISQTPEDPVMTRTLGGFTGWNIDPEPYLQNLDSPHWAQEDMDWHLLHEIITEEKDLDAPQSRGEYYVANHRTAAKVLEWADAHMKEYVQEYVEEYFSNLTDNAKKKIKKPKK